MGFMCSSGRLLNFFKTIFLKNSFRNSIRVSNSLDLDQAGLHFSFLLVCTLVFHM